MGMQNKTSDRINNLKMYMSIGRNIWVAPLILILILILFASCLQKGKKDSAIHPEIEPNNLSRAEMAKQMQTRLDGVYRTGKELAAQIEAKSGHDYRQLDAAKMKLSTEIMIAEGFANNTDDDLTRKKMLFILGNYKKALEAYDLTQKLFKLTDEWEDCWRNGLYGVEIGVNKCTELWNNNAARHKESFFKLNLKVSTAPANAIKAARTLQAEADKKLFESN